jgi:hypothetical protein
LPNENGEMEGGTGKRKTQVSINIYTFGVAEIMNNKVLQLDKIQVISQHLNSQTRRKKTLYVQHIQI